MAVLVRHHVAGMDSAAYDQAASQLTSPLKQQPGFVYHVAFADSGGFTVSEIWESEPARPLVRGAGQAERACRDRCRGDRRPQHRDAVAPPACPRQPFEPPTQGSDRSVTH